MEYVAVSTAAAAFRQRMKTIDSSPGKMDDVEIVGKNLTDDGFNLNNESSIFNYKINRRTDRTK
ncbi:MAG: hypothetical protein ACOY90_20585 [Candidatus Zhuqueibacterota bacterium]